jgi:hypothetical protein
MVQRDERVLVLVENDPGEVPWMHRQDAVAQETPYRFETARALEEPGSCRANRGGTRGSLLLVNHWVDTSPAPKLADCESERRMLPNVVAIDFYREGDVLGQVARLNRAAAR